MSIRLDGRVAVVTGGGRGIGREHALLLARMGAKVVVNDLGASTAGSGQDQAPAEQVVAEIEQAGGEATADYADIADWAQAEALVQRAIDRFGRLDVLVNNAGIIRDRTIVNMTLEEWEGVLRTHLLGTFATTHFAAGHWRDRSKSGEAVDARVINTSSGSGLYGNPGQANYGAAKAAIASFTIIAARELHRYGVTANAIAPLAATRMTGGLLPDSLTPDHIPPLIAWLASESSRPVTGRVFNIGGGKISVAQGWHAAPGLEKEGVWTVAELDDVIPSLVEAAGDLPDLWGNPPGTDGYLGPSIG